MTIVINPNVNAKSGLKRQDFLTRVSGVQAVRTNYKKPEENLTIYIHDRESWEFYRYLQEAICQGNFDNLDNFYEVTHFGIDIPDQLLKWFQNCNIDLIRRQIVCWLSAMYAFEPDRREIMKKQIYLPVMEEIQKLYYDFYLEREPFLENAGQEELYKIYHDACRFYYCATPPIFLDQPCLLKLNHARDAWRIPENSEFDIKIGRFYFNESDWKSIVEDRLEDETLLREESSREYWIKWKHQFASYESHGNHIYSLYDSKLSGGYIYLIREVGTSNYKIGYTSNFDIQKRVSSLQTGNSRELLIHAYFACSSSSTESVLHRIFSNCRIQGEWFVLSEKDVSNILDEEWRRKNNVF